MCSTQKASGGGDKKQGVAALTCCRMGPNRASESCTRKHAHVRVKEAVVAVRECMCCILDYTHQQLGGRGGWRGALPMHTSKTAGSPDEGVISIRCHCAISMRDANLWLEAHHDIHICIPLLLEG